MYNADVLNPDAAAEFIADKAAGDPRGTHQRRLRPLLREHPVLLPPELPRWPDGRFLRGQRYRGSYEFSQSSEYRISFRGGQYTEYVFAGPHMPEILGAYTRLTGRIAPPPLWSLGTTNAGGSTTPSTLSRRLRTSTGSTRSPATACGWTSNTWMAIESSPGIRTCFPIPGDAQTPQGTGFRVITIIDPGVKYDPGYEVFDSGLERDVFCRTEGGDVYIGQVWPGNTAFPDFATEEARAGGGDLTRRTSNQDWRDLERHERASNGPDSADRMLFGHGQYSHERFRNQYALLMAMATTAGLRKQMPELRTFVLSRAGFAGINAMRRTGWGTTSHVGTTCG